MRSARRVRHAILVATATFAGDAGAGLPFQVDGPSRADVDAASPTIVRWMVPVEGPIEDLDVAIALGGSFTDGVRVTLSHEGVSVVLYEGAGDTLASSLDVTFDDEASTPVSNVGSALGPVQPVAPLAAFDGGELSGIWELRIEESRSFPGDGTDLLRFALRGEAGIPGPPLSVALYAEETFVDSVLTSWLQDAIGELGHEVEQFVGISEIRFETALADADVLVLPDLSQAWLDSLPPGAEAAMSGFVQAGGSVVAVGVNASVATASLFGLAIFPDVPLGLVVRRDAALGTRFQAGPYSTPWLGASGLDAFGGGRFIYYEAAVGSTQLVWHAFGAGVAVFLTTPDIGVDDLSILSAALLDESRAFPRRRVAFFADPAFADVSDDPNAEGASARASLEALGHTVRPFTGIDAASFTAGLAGSNALAVPELTADLAAVLSSEARAVLAGFVDGGGVLVKLGSLQRDADLLNAALGFSLSADPAPVSSDVVLQSAAVGTRFDGANPTLPGFSATRALSGLPDGARTIHQAAGLSAATAWIPFGAGRAIWLGWDWNGAAPRGALDSGWLDTLHRAVIEAPEPGATLLGVSALAALALRRRLPGAGARPRRSPSPPAGCTPE